MISRALFGDVGGRVLLGLLLLLVTVTGPVPAEAGYPPTVPIGTFTLIDVSLQLTTSPGMTEPSYSSILGRWPKCCAATSSCTITVIRPTKWRR